MRIQDIGEFGLIEKIRRIVGRTDPSVVLGIGDDTAVIDAPGDRYTLITADMMVEGVHFSLKYCSFSQLGWRCMAANLSDIAAMSGTPKTALISLAITPSCTVQNIESLYEGMRSLADEYAVTIVGGDTVMSPSGIFISITLLGSVSKNLLTTRAGARPGDAIYVTGALGGAQAGLRILRGEARSKYGSALKEAHLVPHPRVREAIYLRQHAALHAMIDVSDGLSSEINHICSCSNVGAVLLTHAIPLAAGVKEIAAARGENAISYALDGGEDFELVFTAVEAEIKPIARKFQDNFGLPVTKIGSVVHEKQGVRMVAGDAEKSSLLHRGYDHFKRN